MLGFHCTAQDAVCLAGRAMHLEWRCACLSVGRFSGLDISRPHPGGVAVNVTYESDPQQHWH